MTVLLNRQANTLNDVILSDAKNLAFSFCYKNLHGACPERNDKIQNWPEKTGQEHK
jgi:hypothetical protein